MKNRIKQIHFDHCLVQRWQKGWAVFTHEPQNQKGYIYFIEKGTKNTFICIPLWTSIHRKEVEKKSLTFLGAVKLAWNYDKFYEASSY